MAYEVDEEYEHSESTFVLVDEGIYTAHIFEVKKAEKDDSQAKGGKRRYYVITLRIEGGEFDGVDVVENYVGLAGKSLFRLYDILKALGELEKYYDSEQKRWHHIPAPEDLEGKKLFIKVEHEPFQAKDRDTKLPLQNPDGSPKMLNSAKPTDYFNASEPMPEFKRTRRNPGTPAGVSPDEAAANVAAMGGTEVASGTPAW